ncbi:PepSY domain-containing protein [Vaginisenegalia massiliensis]|uniref:PepSY domain-containing protein n=1 Tax=Vaginisenegalia massiliensis TaxID=2058294 RepID=UPI000F5278F8|nr:PepSY domain-containing protein [Vaginisenegalia massiliensis]
MAQNKNDNLANSLILLAGVLFGAASAWLIKENKPMPAGKVLEKLKTQFAQEGEIEGSWIDYDPVESHAFDSRPLVYQGGITRKEASGTVYYEFTCDCYTGEILTINEQAL